MPVLFTDSFGHYTLNGVDATNFKWDSYNASQIDLPSALARTNTGVCEIVGGVAGPQKLLGAHYTKLIGQTCVNANTPGVTQNPDVMRFEFGGLYNIGVRIRGDGAALIFRGNGDTAETMLAASTSRPFIWATMNSIECQCFFDATQGSVLLRVNGQVVINISGIRTVAQVATPYTDRFQLFGHGAGTFVHGDFVLIDWSAAPNNTFIDQAKVYVVVPVANGSPLAWTPLAPPNFSQVNEIPADGDTSYNFSANIGDTDTYQVQASPTVPGAANIQAFQHCMDLKVDSGARTVASVVGGTVNPVGNALGALYTIFSAPQDSVPSFPVGVGPKVTA